MEAVYPMPRPISKTPDPFDSPGEDSLRYAVTEYIEHHHHERTHQGKDNRLLFPLQPSDPKPRDGPVQCRELLGGLLKFYYKAAA